MTPAIEQLQHMVPECTGNWRLTGAGDDRRVKCDTCVATYSATPENRMASIDENYAGIYLRRLTAEGMRQITPDKGSAT